MKEENGGSDVSHQMSKNPFVVETPEKLTPGQIVALFVEKFTRLETIKQRKHTFIWGSRGSGKSMMARYLEPRCQQLHKNVEEQTQQGDQFLAIYCPCKEGHLNRSEFKLLERSSSLILGEHSLNLLIADRTVHCFIEQFPESHFDHNALVSFSQQVARLFDRASIATSIAAADSEIDSQKKPLKWLSTLVDSELRNVAQFLRASALRSDANYDGATSGYHDFLLPFFRLVKSLPVFSRSTAYIMLDDADRLTKDQQSIVNEWIANRDHSYLCFKVSARRDHYRTMQTRSGSLLEQPHDFSEIDVDELYTRSKSDFWKKVRLIADRRLSLAKMNPADIVEFLPSDRREEELLEKIRAETAEEWKRVGEPGRKDDYVHRYAVPRLFQFLRRTRKRKSYAGFDNLVDLSSGVVREFLEPCYLMFDRVVSAGNRSEKVNSIPTSIQNDVIYRYSEEFLLNKFEGLRQELPPEEWGRLDKLRCLIESLGRLFYDRLHDATAREARVFSFTVRGSVSQEVSEVLRLGVRYRYLQQRTYSSKEGGGRENWYILNRRLCPMFKLDPSGFEGRISLTADMVELACEDSDKFVRLRLRQDRSNVDEPLFAGDERGDDA